MTEKDLLMEEVVIDLGHISPVLIDTGNIHVHESTQIETQHPQKSDGPGMLPWTL